MAITWEQAEAIQKAVIEKGEQTVHEVRVDHEGKDVAVHYVVEISEYATKTDIHLFKEISPTGIRDKYLLALQWGSSKVKSMWINRYEGSNEAPVFTYFVEKLDIGDVDANLVIGALRKVGFYE